MGKYLRKITSQEYAKPDKLKGQRLYGPTVFVGDNNECVFTLKNTPVDDITNFEWEFGQDENNHPCVFITFLSKHEKLNSSVVCLETNSYTKFGKNRCLNVFGRNTLREEYENISYIKIANIEIGKKYKLYITAPINGYEGQSPYKFSFGPWRESMWKCYPKFEQLPDDWKIKINIRPSFREIDNGNVVFWQMKNLPDYKNVEYYYKDEKIYEN